MHLRLCVPFLVITALTLVSGTAYASDDDVDLQGVWFGDGLHPMNRKVLIVDGDQFTIVSPLGSFVSKYKTNRLQPLNEIDIVRYDGEQQLGVFELQDTHLLIAFSEPNHLRPELKDVRFADGKGHWHTKFRRRPTPEGLEVLAKHMNRVVASD